MNRSEKPHVMAVPFPGLGHFIPFLDLAKLLASHGLTVSYVTTPANVPRLQGYLDQAPDNDALDIRLVAIPPPLLEGLHGCESTDLLPLESMRLILHLAMKLQDPFDIWMEQQFHHQAVAAPVCIVYDIFMGWAVDTAQKFNIASFLFNTCGAFATSLLHSISCSMLDNTLEKDEEDESLVVSFNMPRTVRLSKIEVLISNIYWLAALVDSIGKIDFGQRSFHALPQLLKRIEHLLQFERLMPSYNGVLTVSCIHTLTQIALKLSHFVSLQDLEELIKPFQNANMEWQVRLEATKAFINLEADKNGLGVALSLAVRFIENEPSLRVQAKVLMHCLYLCQGKKDAVNSIDCTTLASLLNLLESRKAFGNVTLQHQMFCILHILAGRSPTLYHIRKSKILSISAKSMDAEVCDEKNLKISAKSVDAEVLGEQRVKPSMMKIRFSRPHVSVNYC